MSRSLRTVFASEEDRKQYAQLNTQLKKYGIDIIEYEYLLHKQKGRCAICKKDLAKGKRRPHVDHDHSNGAIRGILCNLCNIGLGMFHDNTRLLAGAIVYLEKSQ